MDEQEQNRVYIRKTKPSFTREQRAGFVLVISAGAVALILGLVYVASHLADPFNIDYTGPVYLTQQQQDVLEILKQQESDTDGDTLSDYNELYVYKTSPYLQDTDGDSFTDSSEILTGGDPNCAAGDDCGLEEDIGSSGSSLDLVNFGDTGDGETDNTQAAIAQIQDVINNLSVADIRQMLINSGADADSVNAMSDDEVQAFFDSVVTELSTSGELDTLIEGSIQ